MDIKHTRTASLLDLTALNVTCKCFSGQLKNPFPTSLLNSKAICLAGISAVHVLICRLLLKHYGRVEGDLQREWAGNGDNAASLSCASATMEKAPLTAY